MGKHTRHNTVRIPAARRALAALAVVATALACASTGWAGVAAYQLDGGTSCPAHISYWLSGDATSVTIDVIDAVTGAVVYTFPTITGPGASKGFHSGELTWSGEANGGGTAPSGNYKLRATVVAPGSGANTTKMAPIWESVAPDGTSNGWRIYGIAMNNNPDSPFYGRIYVGNYQNDGGRTKAVWELNPDGTVIGTLPTTDGVSDPIFGPSGPWGLCVDWDGDVYVSNRSAASSGGAGPGVWRYHWSGSAWTISPQIFGTSNDRYLGCSMQSGANLKLIDTFYQTIASPGLCRLYAATGDPPASFAKVGGDKSISDLFMQPAIDTDGTVYVAGINQVHNTQTPAIGALTKWNMAGTMLGRNANLTQCTGCCLTPDGQTLWLARPVGPAGGSPSNFEDPNDTSPGAQADKCFYKLPKSEAMTAVAYPTPSPNLRKYGLQTSFITTTGMNMPRFIVADGSSNLLVASVDSHIESRGLFFGLYKEPTGTTPTTEVRVGRNTIVWTNDLSPEYLSGSVVPSPVACGGSVVVTVTARDENSVPGGENDIASCTLYCPELGIGNPGDPESAVAMTLVSGPDDQKRNVYSIAIPIAPDAPTGAFVADVTIKDVHPNVQSSHGACTITVTGGFITGVVTEGWTGLPAQGVTVRATSASFYREDVTDSNGIYTIDVTPGLAYSVAPVTNSYGNTVPTEYNLQSDWPNIPGTSDWPQYAYVTQGAYSTASGRVWPLAITQATYDWNTRSYRAGGRTVCVMGTVLRQAADSTTAPNQKGYDGYYWLADMLGGAGHDTQQAVKVNVFAKGSECRRGDKVVVVGTYNPPPNYLQGVVTPVSAPVVLSHNNPIPAPRDATSFSSSMLYSDVIGGWYVLPNKTVARVGTNEEFYVQVPDAPPTVEFRIDLDTIASTGIGYPTLGRTLDIYGILDEMAPWNQLRAIRPGEPGDAGIRWEVSDIPAAKAKPDNTDVGLVGARVTAVAGGGVPAEIAYIEEPSRASGLRIHCAGLPADVGPGDLIAVQGKMATTAYGERYIEATVFNRLPSGASARPIDAIGMGNRDVTTSNALGLFVKTWGRVVDRGADYFMITDGYHTPLKVFCGSLAKPEQGWVVRVRGIVSRDASGPVLLMRGEQLDWTYGEADYQPLPFAGAYKYARDFLVLGPFADANSVPGDPVAARTYRLDHDFIYAATEGEFDETSIAALKPSLGKSVGGHTWQRSQSVGDNASFTAVFGTGNTHCTFYAHIWVWSPTDQTVAMRVGSEDSVKVWVNGVEVWRNLVSNPPASGRSEIQGQDLIPEVSLRAGLNSVLFKVEQDTGTSGVDCQFIPTYAPGSPGWGGAAPLLGLGYVLNGEP